MIATLGNPGSLCKASRCWIISSMVLLIVIAFIGLLVLTLAVGAYINRQ